ncbi:Trehalose-phosphate phosphatase [Leclercia adecarboxylata]|uniref:Trehalose 6-phosphate phosphatase n=1 Tax=Leclercia adecarboxylata TaxID=83655 RepID=A0A4U9HYS2_9ENTR|nr:Trehalose-phosphate phosphatase [Leclercia adecarboxylata]
MVIRSPFPFPPDLVQTLHAQLTTALLWLPGTELEAKGMAFAIHYRRAPEYQQEVLNLAEQIVRDNPQLSLQPGKCVVEIKPRGIHKGEAISAFMHEAPFLGRTPVFFGDDLTDEHGFEVVNQLKGVSVKVGAGETKASWRLATVSDVWQWVIKAANHQQEKEIAQINRRKPYGSLDRSF